MASDKSLLTGRGACLANLHRLVFAASAVCDQTIADREPYSEEC